MSKKNINEMSLEELISDIVILLGHNDIIAFCEDIEIVHNYFKVYKESKGDSDALKQFLIENKDAINKEKLIFRIYLNYKKNIAKAEARKLFVSGEYAKMMATMSVSAETVKEIKTLERTIEIQEKILKRIKDVAKKSDVYIAENKRQNNVDDWVIYSSKEEYNNRRLPEKSKLERWNKINSGIGDNNEGMEYIIRPILLTDLYSIFPDETVGMIIRASILEKAIAKKGPEETEKLIRARDKEDDEYDKIIQSVQPEEYISELREELIKNIRFIDLDKLILVSASRIEEALEKENIEDFRALIFREILIYMKDNLEDKNAKFEGVIEDRETYEDIDLKYSREDIEKCIARFIDDKYVPKKDIEKIKEQLLKGNASTGSIDEEIIKLMELSDKEIKELAHMDPINLKFAIDKLNLSEEEILEIIKNSSENIKTENLRNLYNEKKLSLDSIVNLYKLNYINKEFIIKMAEDTDMADELSITRINDLYIKSKQNEQEDNEQLEMELELYRALNIEGKTDEKFQKQANKIINEIVEDINDEEDLLFYYKNGIIPISTVAEWGGDIVKDLFLQGRITEEEFETAADYMGISGEEYVKILYERTRQLVKVDKEFSIIGLNKIAPEKSKNSGPVIVPTKKSPETLIDPSRRKDFFEALGAVPLEMKNVDRTNPFYNYNFFVILEQGKLKDNNVVIAERFYDDKLNPQDYATSNATYFFKSKDLLINKINSKREALAGNGKTIDKQPHILGKWAVETLSKIAALSVGDEIKKYDEKSDEYINMVVEKLREMYSEKQIKAILSIVSDIDRNPENWYDVEYINIPEGNHNLDENDDGEER